MISNMEFESPPESPPKINHKFEKLKTLCLFDVKKKSAGFYSRVFKDVTSLVELESNVNFGMISQQLKLERLSLHLMDDGFQLMQLNDGIQVTDFGLKIWKRITGSALANLESFIRSQRKVESFHIDILERREKTEEGIYKIFLESILNLETLRSVSTDHAGTIELFPVDRVNHQVRNLVVKSRYNNPIDLTRYLKLFPQLKRLEIHPFQHQLRGNMTAINNSKFLEELVIRNSQKFPEIMHRLKIRNLRKFELQSTDSCPDLTLYQFLIRHPQISSMQLKIPRIKKYSSYERRKFSLENLVKLEKLVMEMDFRNFDETSVGLCEMMRRDLMETEYCLLNYYDRAWQRIASEESFDDYLKRQLLDLTFLVLHGSAKSPWCGSL